ncbi:hypothetical protein [Domibacillus tundrae]|uniref:hypothetical protein n=1 Tax=Domibacillus tundrae TaxID=1587527 RepID=UPI0006180CFB|nr:hypothetical protein [Domibacillus tundrae]
MAIDVVLYKNREVEEEVHINFIEKHKEFQLVRKNLFCAFNGCKARIEYVPKGKKKAYFKTWPKQDHTEGCEDYFEREQKRKSEKGSATIDVLLSQKHIDSVLNDMYKVANESEEERNKRLEKQRKKGKAKNKTIDASQAARPALNINPTTGKEGDDIRGDLLRAPSVKRRFDIQLLSDSDVGYTRAVYGIIDAITIANRHVIITLSSNKKKCNLYFEEAFFADAATNAIGMFKNVEDSLSKDIVLKFSGVGEVVKRNGGIHVVISHQNHFKLNNYRLPLFSFKYLNGKL